MKLTSIRGRAGRILLVVIPLLLITVVMFAIASMFMTYDPDGHLLRNWLHQSRWGLFAWRLVMYASIAAAWIIKVRPQMLKRWPETEGRLPRTELLCVLFILATEYVAWTGTA